MGTVGGVGKNVAQHSNNHRPVPHSTIPHPGVTGNSDPEGRGVKLQIQVGLASVPLHAPGNGSLRAPRTGDGTAVPFEFMFRSSMALAGTVAGAHLSHLGLEALREEWRLLLSTRKRQAVECGHLSPATRLKHGAQHMMGDHACSYLPGTRTPVSPGGATNGFP